MADIKAIVMDKIEEIVEKVKKDDNFAANFKKDPVKAVEGVLGVDLPDDAVEKIVDGVKAKVSLDKIGDIAGNLKGLFNK